MRRFFVKHFNVKSNILTLKKLKPFDLLGYDSSGRLIILASFRKKLLFHAQNLFSFGSKKKRVAIAIRQTIMVFCHEMKNSMDLERHKKIRWMTLEHARQALEAVKKNHFTENLFDALQKSVKEYERASLLQEKILKSMHKATGHKPKDELLLDAHLGLDTGRNPRKASIGASGCYFLGGSQRVIAGVFKPFDEEIGSPNNPLDYNYKGSLGQRLASYKVLAGDGCHKEVAAYIVDQALKFKIVPKTSYASFSHAAFHDTVEGYFLKKMKQKHGSFQEFVAGYSHMLEMPKSVLEAIPFDQFHRLIILDLIIGNMDRNQANLLSNGRKIVAIDHALSYGIEHETYTISHITNLPQLNMPLSRVLAKKVLQLDIDKLSTRLKNKANIEKRALTRMRERLALLQEGVRRNLPTKQIISHMTRENLNTLKDKSFTLNAAVLQVFEEKKIE